MATGENIGMMEGAFFVGRKAILDWLNTLLKTNLTKIEETCSGAIACQLCDALYGPESKKVPMHKVKWDCKADFEYTQNYKILQDVFQKVGVNKVIPVAQLIRGKYQDNLEFMQWFKRFFELNYSGMPEDYDAIKRRAKGKGVATFDKRMASKPKTAQQKENRRTNTFSKRNASTGGGAVNAQLAAKNEELTAENATLLNTVNGLEKERDFYFGKLRDVEILLQNLTENDNEPTKEVKSLSDTIFKILYATEEDFTNGEGGEENGDVENGGEKEESADNESNVNVESKMEVSAPVVKSPAPLPGPVDKSSPQQVNETKETEDNGEDSLGLDDGVETF
eukprot:g3405.t1